MKWLVILIISTCPSWSGFKRVADKINGKCSERTVIKIFKSSETAKWFVHHYEQDHLSPMKDKIESTKIYKIVKP